MKKRGTRFCVRRAGKMETEGMGRLLGKEADAGKYIQCVKER